MEQLDMLTLNQSEESTGFLLRDHYAERIKYHMTMLNYYLKEEKIFSIFFSKVAQQNRIYFRSLLQHEYIELSVRL